MIEKLTDFLKTGIWSFRLVGLSRKKAFFVKQLRVMVLALSGFGEDKCTLKASALTFYTLLSIVPVLAMLFGIAKGFGFENMLEQQLLERFSVQEEVIKQIIAFANSMLENTHGGLIAGIGIALLFWSVIKLLGNIENSFNDVWGIQKSRSIGRKFSDYLSVMFVCPILLIMAGSITVAITTQVQAIVEKLTMLSMFSPFILSCLNLLPYCVIWILFAFLFIYMPNTKIRITSGIIAGIITGTIYQVVQWGYISFQIGVARYNTIYGGFAALPLFLIWIELSWLIVLLGAEISFAYQNVHTYEFEPDCKGVSLAFKRLLALVIVHLILKRFEQGKGPITAAEIVETQGTPIRLVNQILAELVASGVVNEIRQKDERIAGYQPARSVDAITIQYVVHALEQKGSNTMPIARTAELEDIAKRLESFRAQVEGSPENVRLKDI